MNPNIRLVHRGASILALVIAAQAAPALAQQTTSGSTEATQATSDVPVAPAQATAADQADATTGAKVTTAEQPVAESAADLASDKDIIVTGTNISGVKPVGSQTLAIDRSQVLATGYTNVNDVLQTLPQVQNNPNSGGSGPVYRQGGTSGYGGNSTQGTRSICAGSAPRPR